MRVWPDVTVRANSVRSVFWVGDVAAKTCWNVDPPSVDRQSPFWNADPYRVVPSRGSIAKWLTPRTEPAPFQMREKVDPPSEDLYRPKGAASGGLLVAPPVTELTPRTPRVVAT